MTNTTNLKTLSINDLANGVADAMVSAQGALDELIARRQWLTSAAKECKRRKLALPARLNKDAKLDTDGKVLLATIREALESRGLKPAVVKNYMSAFRHAVTTGKEFAFNVSRAKAAAKAKSAEAANDDSASKTKGADKKEADHGATVSTGKASADEYGAILLRMLESKKGKDWAILAKHMKAAMAELCEAK